MMKKFFGMLSIIFFTSSMLSIQSAAMDDQENNFRTIVIRKFIPDVKKWRSYVNVQIRGAGKFSPLHEEMIRRNFDKTVAHFFDYILADGKSIIHDAIEQLSLDSSDANFNNFKHALNSQQDLLSAINYYGIPLGFYAITELHSDEQLIIDVLDELFRYGLSVNYNDGEGKRLLDVAIANNHAQVVRYLLKWGAHPDRSDDSVEPAPLHAAYSQNNLEIIQLLLAAGADSAVCDEEGYALLHHACLKNQYQLARLLLAYHADPDSPDIFGQKPIDYASDYKNQAGKPGIIFRMLMELRRNSDKGQLKDQS